MIGFRVASTVCIILYYNNYKMSDEEDLLAEDKDRVSNFDIILKPKLLETY